MKTETLTPELLEKQPEASHKKELTLRTTKKANTLTPELLHKIDAYWRAANYLAVGQIYLYDNPLLKRPLTLAEVKHMLLGQWGTTPGQNFIYVHLNRVIKKYNLNDLRLRPWARWSGRRGQHLSRGYLQRDLSQHQSG